MKINVAATRAIGPSLGWDLPGHVDRVYDAFRFRGGHPPHLATRPGEDRPAIQQSLMDWKADLGARGRMDWSGFLAKHRRILQRISSLPRLGRLDEAGIARVCAVVDKLEDFKPTEARKLVFGSKAAHFHFPGLVPVMSSEVVSGLKKLAADHPNEVCHLLDDEPVRFSQASAAESMATYQRYVRLGNALLRDVDDAGFRRRLCAYPLHAKLYEWWVIGAGQ